MSGDNAFGFSRVGFAARQADGTYKPIDLDLSTITVKTFKVMEADPSQVVYNGWAELPSVTFTTYFESHKIYCGKLVRRRLKLPTIDARCLRRR